ncbi:hypothetical protein GCM10017673_35220 [Streptosporangium violaceochromogenes]|nr:hypothetical protein GCM10017673_35220 [Streptosporangium violaceochromogenes]
MRVTLATATAAFSLAALSFGVIPASVASAASPAQPAPSGDPVRPFGACGQTFSPSVPGGKAFWRLSCSRGSITVTGWVEDTDEDTQCAQVKAHFPGGIWEYSRNACPLGARETFTWTHPGDIADVYLFTHAA